MKIMHYFSKSSVEYDSESGIFIWVVCCRKPWMEGELATRETTNHYLYIKADNKFHSASRLAWELVTGEKIPDDLQIDHIDQIKGNNKFTNLRVVDDKTNKQNVTRLGGITGHLGVSFYDRYNTGIKYRARLGNKTTYHETLEEAVRGYAKLVEEKCF